MADQDAVVRDAVAAARLAMPLPDATRAFIAQQLEINFKGIPLEHLVADMFRALGYRARATRASRDDGIDVVAHRDVLSIEPPLVKIQVKARIANVSADVVKAFSAVVADRDVGIVMTTGGFTRAALDFARTRHNLRLWDGIKLADLIHEVYDRLDLKYRQQIPLHHVLLPGFQSGVAGS